MMPAHDSGAVFLQMMEVIGWSKLGWEETAGQTVTHLIQQHSLTTAVPEWYSYCTVSTQLTWRSSGVGGTSSVQCLLASLSDSDP